MQEDDFIKQKLTKRKVCQKFVTIFERWLKVEMSDNNNLNTSGGTKALDLVRQPVHGAYANIMLFCPICANLLVISAETGYNKWACNTCAYEFPISKQVRHVFRRVNVFTSDKRSSR